MNSIWIPIKYKNDYLDSDVQGLKLYFLDVEINEDLRNESIKFCRWLRKNYWFPLRCNIRFEYFSTYKDNSKAIKYAQAIFYSPKIDDQGLLIGYPDIRIAVAKYEEDIKRCDKNKVLYYYFHTIAHELTHYFQWYFFEFDHRTNRSLEIEATKWANYLVAKYMEETTSISENDLID